MQNNLRTRFAISSAHILMIALSTTWTAPAAAATREAEQGSALFVSFGCYQCHGHFGQGASTGPKLAPDPYPFEAFKVFVRTPVARMPPYSENVLSDEQLRRIHAYLQSIETGPAADAIPLLNESAP